MIPIEEPVRILLLAANPSDTETLRLGQEARSIKDALEKRTKISFDLQRREAVRSKDLRFEVLSYKPHFVHFSGHGEGEEGIVLEDDNGATHLVTTEALESFFEIFKEYVRCVFLNCCYSRPQAEAIARHIPFVIGTRDKISDKAAIEFSVAFYEAIGQKEDVPRAFRYGIAALKLSNLFSESRVPILIPELSIPQPGSKKPAPGPLLSVNKQKILRNWILDDHCRLVLLRYPDSAATRARELSASGGEALRSSSLLARIAGELRLRDSFEFTAFANLDSAPPITETLSKLLSALSATRHFELAEHPEEQIRSLLRQLREHRCLLLLEGADALFDREASDYLPGYADYGDFFRKIAETKHQSCVLLTSRREVPEIARNGPVDQVRFIDLRGLKKQSEKHLALVRKLQTGQPERVGAAEELPRVLPPQILIPTCEDLSKRAEIASRASVLRAEERLPRRHSANTIRTLVPIQRTDTQPDFEAFFCDPRPLLAVVGDSGTGKSTLFYQVYRTIHNSIAIFYDVHELQATRSLAGRIARDLHCEEQGLDIVLVELDRVLVLGGRRLLILVDGLNESRDIKPSALRFEIESLASRLPTSIKIAYSCRKVYWENYIASVAPLSKDIYFGSKEFLLGRFSPAEAKIAFQTFQELYGFGGSYSILSAEFKQRVTDPLMMRMLAEGYEGKQLPVFAPAVLIFEGYEKKFRQTFKGTVVPEFLRVLVASKLIEAESAKSTDQFSASEMRIHPQLSLLIQQQEANHHRPGDPLILLEDEGILTAIDEEHEAYRFSYDRFFEYLLGKALSPHLTEGRRDSYLDRLRQLLQKLSTRHFSFLQALKSEVIRLNIAEPAGPWSMYNPAVIRSLIDDPDTGVAHFAKDLLRELMFEGREDLLPVLERVYEDDWANHLLLLDVASDSSRILSLVVKGLASGVRDTARRCCHILIHSLVEIENGDIVEGALLDMLRHERLNCETAVGLIYYTAVLFSESSRRDADPFPVVRAFWRRAWNVLGGAPSILQILIEAFIKIVRAEGGQFFGDSSATAMDYVWNEMAPELRTLANRMVSIIKNPELDPDPELREIIFFFGSNIRNWEDRRAPSRSPVYCYKFAYKIAQWALILKGKFDYFKLKEILSEYVDTGHWMSIDFALGVMEQCCIHHLWQEKKLLTDGYRTMLEWTAKFSKDEKNFYMPLFEADPFAIDQCPIEMASRVAALYFSPAEGPVSFLESWIASENQRDVLLGLLCARALWRDHPIKIARTIELAVRSDDRVVSQWLDRIVKEMYLVFPRLIDDFFWRSGMEAGRVREIKHRSDIVDPSAVEHNGDPFYRYVFLGPAERRDDVIYWAARLHQSTSLESFCADLLAYIALKIMSES